MFGMRRWGRHDADKQTHVGEKGRRTFRKSSLAELSVKVLSVALSLVLAATLAPIVNISAGSGQENTASVADVSSGAEQGGTTPTSPTTTASTGKAQLGNLPIFGGGQDDGTGDATTGDATTGGSTSGDPTTGDGTAGANGQTTDASNTGTSTTGNEGASTESGGALTVSGPGETLENASSLSNNANSAGDASPGATGNAAHTHTVQQIVSFNPDPYSNPDDPDTHYIVVDKGTAQKDIPLPTALKGTTTGGGCH